MSSKALLIGFVVLVALTTGCGGGRTSSTSVSGATPSGSALALTSVTPDSAIVANPVTVQVTGSGFDNSSVIMLDGQSVATSVVSSTTLSTTLAANTATQPTQVDVAVSSASSKRVSNLLQFYWVAPLAITSTTLAPATQGTSYQVALGATGGRAPYTWVAKSSLPAGLTMSSSGTIGGTPTSSGNYSVSITVNDSSSPAKSVSATLALQVTPQSLKLASSALPSGTAGKAYSGTVSATGGTTPYTWSISSGSLPAGLSLASATGVISGTPTSSGTFNFTVSVSDSSSTVQKQSATTAIVVAAATSPVTITTASLPSGTVNTAYTATVVGTGGVAPYTWSVSSGALPTGVSLGSSTGLISGTPSASGTFNVTLSVHDAQGNSAMSNFPVTIVAALAIATVGLPSATDGTVYAATLSATGGTPGYTWSIPSGQLPTGLTLAATTGEISGTPSATGTFSFTTAVSDSGNPPKTQSMASSIVVTAPAPQTGPKTWYVLPSGGPRYSATNNSTGDSCSGSANAAMVTGGGPNQACGFNDVRYLWTDGGSMYGNWAISGGDTVIIANTYPSGQTGWRIGAGSATSGWFNGYAGVDATMTGSYNPVIPAGTSSQHTRILGANFSNCSAASAKSQIFGGFSVSGVLNLESTQYVDVECLEITDHNNCIKSGTAGLPSVCSNNVPVSDYANNGILTNQTTANITMQDLNIHGLPHSGIGGPIGGAITMTRVRSSFNGFAGWDFDLFGATGPNETGFPNAPGSSINANYVEMSWNGCNEEYPIVDSIPITYCYSITNQGFGDAWSGQDSTLSSMTCDYCTMAYNIKDAFFGPHTAIGTLTITNSTAYGNGGQTWKANLGATGTLTFQNNLTVNNCYRLSQPIPGAPSTFNTYISDNPDLCRPSADGAAIAMVFPISGSVDIDHNIFVVGSPSVSLDFTCWTQIAGVTVNTGGSGYQVGDVLWLGGTQANVTVTAIGAGGAVSAVTINSGGQITTASTGTENYIAGGHGTGVIFNITSVTPVSCGGGPRIMRDNIFLGYNDTTAKTVFNITHPLSLFCYSGCNGNPGTFTDAMWTNRTNNMFWGFTPGSNGACTYSGETCASDPLLVNEPSQTWSGESQLDNFTFNLTSGSPAKGAGVAVPGLTTDYNGYNYVTPPSDGALEFGSPTTRTMFVAQ